MTSFIQSVSILERCVNGSPWRILQVLIRTCFLSSGQKVLMQIRSFYREEDTDLERVSSSP